jgi:AraC family transcriptional regulator, dual regulator of chb operon
MTDYINNPNRGIVSYINDPEQLKIGHSHDYYEFFLVHKGHAVHFVNGFAQPLSSSFLIFVRPEDFHYYDNMSEDFQIINAMVPSEIINSLFTYLGSGFGPERLLNTPFSPTVHLSQNSFDELLNELEQLVVFKKVMQDKVNSLFRITIMNMITRYFPITFAENRSSMPEWFRWLSLEMLKKENFVEGLPKMHQLSGKTIEHMTRVCRKYLNKTPTQFINEIRMTFSAQLLISTTKKVIDICYEVGFSNLSNYYHLFNEFYGMSPVQLRKNKDNPEVIQKIYQKRIVDSSITQGLPFR